MICIEHEDCRTNMTLSMACFERTFATIGARFIWHTVAGSHIVEVVDNTWFPTSLTVRFVDDKAAPNTAIHMPTAAVVRLEE